MTDASFRAAGYTIMVEDDPQRKITSTRKTYAPVAFGSKTFSPAQLKISIYAKEFLAIYFESLTVHSYTTNARQAKALIDYNNSDGKNYDSKSSEREVSTRKVEPR